MQTERVWGIVDERMGSPFSRTVLWYIPPTWIKE
jgi:hypothetical protein